MVLSLASFMLGTVEKQSSLFDRVSVKHDAYFYLKKH